MHRQIMADIVWAEVQLGEAGAAELVEFIHHWDGVSILDGDGIERGVVDTKSP